MLQDLFKKEEYKNVDTNGSCNRYINYQVRNDVNITQACGKRKGENKARFVTLEPILI